MIRKEFLEMAAQCWCDDRVSDKTIDSELALVFSEKLVEEWDKGFNAGHECAIQELKYNSEC